MRKCIKYFVLIIIFFILTNQLYPQEIPVQVPIFPEHNPSETTDSDVNDNSKNINLDMQVLYGIQYNQMFSNINLSQESSNFVYLLTSDFSKSGDFGYNDEEYVNSGFYENKLGLTVNWNWTNAKFIIEGEVDNDSRGMFTNEVYSKEEKGKNRINKKTVFKVNPSSELYFSFGGAWYKHSLVALNPDDHVKSRLLQGNGILGGEFVWSASNRLRWNTGFLYNDYNPEEITNDNEFRFELFDDFSIIRNLGISIGAGYVRNNDEREIDFPFPLSAGLSIKGYKNFSFSLSYKYDILPFQPEEFYLEQKYIYPNYNLPPQIVHNGEAKTNIKINDMLNIKINFDVEKNDSYYNYFPVAGNVLSADTVEVIKYDSLCETNLSFYEKMLEFSFGYEYFYFDAEEHISYQPDYKALSSFRYNAKKWKFEWSNYVRGKVYIDPDTDEKISEAFIGSLGIQRIVLEGSYFYAKIDNLYNNRYTLREGYPEPGISFLGGLRILI